MRMLITGATGFVGNHLTRALKSRHELICLQRKQAHLKKLPELSVIEGDLRDRNLYDRLPKKIETVIHLAQAKAKFPEEAPHLFDINTFSTLLLAEYARRIGVSRFIFASSGNVYARSADAIREDSICQPSDFYGLTKLTAEQILSHYEPYLNICVLRLFAPYGPGQKNRLIPNIIEKVRSGQPIILKNGGEPLINPVFISDLVQVFEKLSHFDGSHILNVAGPEVVTIRQIAEVAGKAFNCEPIFECRTDNEHSNLIADTSRLQRICNVSSWLKPADGILRMIEKI